MEQSPNSDTTTDGIRIQASARYVPEQSDPDRGLYLYSYRIRIVNEGTQAARLLSRHWVILDAHNHRDEVVGEGVVGKQPDLAPEEMFEYTSTCSLSTEWGTMEGTYTLERPGGQRFEVAIGRFFLAPSTHDAGLQDTT